MGGNLSSRSTSKILNYENILLIDDAVGSGSTLNETAKKIRQRGQCRGKIIGLAIQEALKALTLLVKYKPDFYIISLTL
jgi:predicted amidophosphoribosyltransferase